MPKYISKQEQIYATSFFFEIFMVNVYFVWCKDKHRLQEFVKRNHDGDRDEIHEQKDGCTYFISRNNSKPIPLISLHIDFDYSANHIALLHHEVIHAVIGIFRIMNIPLPKDIHYSLNDEESFCYHSQWLFQKCLDALVNQDEHKFRFSEESLLKK